MEQIIEKIKMLQESQLLELENYIEYLMWKKPKKENDNNPIIPLLNSIPLAQSEIDKALSQKIVSHFNNKKGQTVILLQNTD